MKPRRAGKDDKLTKLQRELCEKHRCHTVILYGSRARGDATENSDYDLLGIRAEGEVLRDARVWEGVYLDLFIFPESKIRKPDHSLIYLKDGKVLCERDGIGTRLLHRLKAIDDAGPEPLPADEIQARRVWARKMVERAGREDAEGNFRRAWLLAALLEDYYLIRRRWYRGPKESLQILQRESPELFALYERALTPGAPLAIVRKLVEAMVTD